MLRFDVPPVYSNVARVEAFFTTIAYALGIIGFIWLIPLVAVQSFIRGFINPHKCFFHLGVEKALCALKKEGHKENAGAKMFAQKLLFIASIVTMLLYFNNSSLVIFPLSVITAFSILEWAFSFCIACWAYSIFYQIKGRFSQNG
jgi:cellulose synthase/poly-beta-1,6-N-acetylglucosamine synthase-like glycosyltransferase